MKVNLDGIFEVGANAAETYAFIHDPTRFAPILPYFRELRSVEANGFTVVLEVGVPQIRGRAEVVTTRIEQCPGERLVYAINGRHALGMIDARMTFDLTATEEGCRVAWVSEGVVSGTLASLAQGILLPLAKRQIQSLVIAVRKALGPVGPAVEAAEPGLIRRGVGSVKGLFAGRQRAEADRAPADQLPS